MTPFVSTSTCSWGVSGSPCRGDFECDSGYDRVSGVCTGQIPCASDAECPIEANVCTEQGTCSPHGNQGDGCALGAFCREGLICLSSVCTVVLGEGDDCTVPATTCDGPFACFPSTGTCETPLPLGSSCTANVECAGYPADDSCNEAVGSGVCSPRQGDGGPCAEDIDCAFPFACDPGTQTCD